MTADYHRYWGKTSAAADGSAAPCHLLVYHCLDVAAVGHRLLDNRLSWTTALADRIDMAPDVLRDLFVYSLTLHDMGKFACSFQSLAEPDTPHLIAIDRRFNYDRKHDALGAEVWREHVRDALPAINQQRTADLLGYLDMQPGLDGWMDVFFGHHGKPVSAGDDKPIEADFRPHDLDAASAFAQTAEELIKPHWPFELFADSRWCVERLAPATWSLAGLATLADWIGSNADYFRLCDEPMPLADYWHAYALPGAEQALAATGLTLENDIRNFYGFQYEFGFDPTPLQAWTESVDLAPGPQLFILEDITGTGKTEAALALAHRLLAEGRANGLYFGLPTTATSNAMYGRLGHYYRGLFDDNARPSLVLAHGARQLSDTFTESIIDDPTPDRDYAQNEPTGGIECRAWLADNRKKALLAEVGVGTIDQALLGVLPRKHQSLRLLGLADKVLIVDEVHAYDTYTSRLLQSLLTAHAAAGGSVILLSATMPHNLRLAFTNVWQTGRGLPEFQPVEDTTAFPLATRATDSGIEAIPVASRETAGRSLPVAFVHDFEQAVGQISRAAREGGCACWVRNTVDDAIAAFDALSEALGDDAEVTLFHARFTQADRQRIETDALARFGESSTSADRGRRVLVATQVVEQSLDLDFDVMVSDLAPIDLLIQRAGRLHRHPRDESGNRLADANDVDQRAAPVFTVLAPAWSDDPPSDWVQASLPGTSYVYRDPAVLWHTCRILRSEGAITLPERARTLLESVYGDTVDVPDGLQTARTEHEAGQSVHRSMAHFNMLSLEDGYPQSKTHPGWCDDQEIGTRLSNEATYRIVVVTERNGALVPWHVDWPQPWAMSVLNLRQNLAQRLPDPPPHLNPQIDALHEQRPWLRATRFWLPEDDGASYDGERGATFDESPIQSRNGPD